MSAPGGRIAAVDDDAEFLEQLCYGLQRSGFETLPLSRPGLAFRKIRASNVDAVLLDLDMPAQSGFDILKRLRHCARTHELPALLLTGRASAQNLRLGFDLGLDDFMPKTTALAEIVARLGRSVHRYRHSAGRQYPLGAPPAAPDQWPPLSTTAPSSGPAMALLILDLAVLSLLPRSDRSAALPRTQGLARALLERIRERTDQPPMPAVEQGSLAAVMVADDSVARLRIQRLLFAANRRLRQILPARLLIGEESGVLQRVDRPPLRAALIEAAEELPSAPTLLGMLAELRPEQYLLRLEVSR